MQKYRIRELQPDDNKRLEQVIRACLIEIGQNREGTIWTDPMLGERLKSTQAKASITGFWRMKKARYPAESVLGKLKGTMMYASCRNSIVFRNSEVLEQLRH